MREREGKKRERERGRERREREREGGKEEREREGERDTNTHIISINIHVSLTFPLSPLPPSLSLTQWYLGGLSFDEVKATSTAREKPKMTASAITGKTPPIILKPTKEGIKKQRTIICISEKSKLIEFVHWPDSNAQNLYANLPSATKLLRVRFSLRIKTFLLRKLFHCISYLW